VGIVELLGAFGLLLPWGLNVLPILTPLSAIGFAIIMILAARIHYRRKEFKTVVFVNGFLFLLCVAFAYIRFNQIF
jgi:hypothetical protein